MHPRPLRSSPPHLAVLLVTALLSAGGVTACASTGGPAGAGGGRPAPVTLDEKAAGTTVRVPAGSTVLVTLHSTYWSTPASSDPQVLARSGGAGSSPGGSCPPGGGCGVSSAGFTALRPGTARLSAQRSSCGEAMRCPPGRDRYEVTVAVVARTP